MKNNSTLRITMKNRAGFKFNPHAWAAIKKNRKMKIKNFISEVFTDYCSHTSLHGIGYLGAKNKTLPEKILWMSIFIASLTVCIYLITDTWLKWKRNPVILNFETEQTPIWSIPFPAVTICPLNKVKQSVYNYTEVFKRRRNLTGDEYKKFWDISLMCCLWQYDHDELFESTINITDEGALKNIFSAAPQMSNTLYNVKWQNFMNVSLFSENINKEGLCFSFNSLIKDDKFITEKDSNHKVISTKWTMEDGYPLDSNFNEYPRRTAQVGLDSGLSINLYSYDSDQDYICGVPMSGYKIILHNPTEAAKASQQYFLVNLDRIAAIMVTPDLTTTSTSLRSLSPRERKCYFSNEKTLRFYTVYNQNNCRLECDANVTEHYCGCLPIYMPRAPNSSICGYGKIKCLEEIEKKILDFQMIQTGIGISEEMKSTTYKIHSNCDCLPACNDLQYRGEITNTKVNYMESKTASNIYDANITPEQKEGLIKGTLRFSKVDIFFKESDFLALRRTELYGRTDFVANCGGLLGLFLGFSILSLVEIIYFLTLRIWCKIINKDYK